MAIALNGLSGTDSLMSYADQINALSVQYPGTDGKGVLNPEVFYTKQLLDSIRLDAKEYCYYRLADASPIGNKADKLQIRRWAPLQAHTVPLVEGIPPISDKGSVEMYEISAAQYGRFMEFTDKVDFSIVDPTLVIYSQEYSLVILETYDMLARETLFNLADTYYAGLPTNFEGLTVPTAAAAGSKPNFTDLRKIVLNLKKKLVKPRANGRFHVIASPDFYYDMVDDETVKTYMELNHTTSTMYENSKLIPLFELEFYETAVCPVHGKFYKTLTGETDARECLRVVAWDSTTSAYVYKTIVPKISADDTAYTSYAVNATTLAPVWDKTVAGGGFVKDSRTGQDASYIPNLNANFINLAGFNAEANAEAVTAGGKTSVPNAGLTYYELQVNHVLIVGKDALIRTGLKGEDQAKMYVKEKGSAGVLDPIDQRQSIGFKINSVGFGSARTEAITDYMCIPTISNEI